ncbi:hypothetical protein CXG81DRAFT_19833 [Caulochytrium protostelioides]|uniref:Uncharacterized protein n=1 Tax=Caulochytrium protostelioides TaxID=1555241 RepID=A0A4P9X539_9FUNG|nr:hypothetical protein CXG81DRAFT_19833 [Caulochytrium protostelioides]|eukprot:RKP00171.1 hypothetical protein CXG81DRAFT_19833 [Caulochytrium protostelioides]
MVERSGGSVAGSHGRPRYLVAQGRLTALSVLLAVMLVLAARLPGAAASDRVSGESGASSMEWSDDNIKLHMDPFLVPVRPDDMALWPMSPRDQALIERMNVLNREYSRAFAADRFTFTELDIRPLVAFEALTAGLVPSKTLQRWYLDPSVFWPTFLHDQVTGLIRAIHEAQRELTRARWTPSVQKHFRGEGRNLLAMQVLLAEMSPFTIRSDGPAYLVVKMLDQVNAELSRATKLIKRLLHDGRPHASADPRGARGPRGPEQPTAGDGIMSTHTALVRFHARLVRSRFWAVMRFYDPAQGVDIEPDYSDPAQPELGLWSGPKRELWWLSAQYGMALWSTADGATTKPDYDIPDDWIDERVRDTFWSELQEHADHEARMYDLRAAHYDERLLPIMASMARRYHVGSEDDWGTLPTRAHMPGEPLRVARPMDRTWRDDFADVDDDTTEEAEDDAATDASARR